MLPKHWIIMHSCGVLLAFLQLVFAAGSTLDYIFGFVALVSFSFGLHTSSEQHRKNPNNKTW